MAQTAMGTVQEWFRGSKDEEVSLPVFSLLDRLVLTLFAFLVESVCSSHGHPVLAFLAVVSWVTLLAFALWDLVHMLGSDRSRSIRLTVGNQIVTQKWYARVMTVIAGALVAMLVLAVLF